MKWLQGPDYNDQHVLQIIQLHKYIISVIIILKEPLHLCEEIGLGSWSI